jgi:DNA polymerase-3 subunit gamma/tau
LAYLVLARKWRPQTFTDLIGQEHVSQTLKNAIESGRVAHAFLFTGARGVGKTSAARILAKALNCDSGPTSEPCNTCPSCNEITAGTSVDVFEIDGASNTGVDDIRDLRDTVKYLPARCRFKIFIIDEVHMLSTSAFNALLKTLEEPPPHIKFIFATTEPHKLPITILSRCQRFDFKRMQQGVISSHLRRIVDQEGIEITDAALSMIARKGDGSMRDALSVLDQVLAFCGEQVRDEEVITLLGVVDRRLLLETSQAVFGRDSTRVLDIVKRVDSFGYNMRQFCQELLDHFRSMTIMAAVGPAADLPDLSEAEKAEIREKIAHASLNDLQRHMSILLKAEGEIAASTFPRLVLEMALLKMANLAPAVPVNEIIERLKALERTAPAGMIASPPPSWNKSPVDREPAITPRSAPAAQRQNKATPSSDHRDRSKGTEPPPPVQAGPNEITSDKWSGFVAFLKGKKPLLASILEHGRPLKVSPDSLEIAFPEGSFQLNNLRDQKSMEELKGFAKTFFKGEPSIHLVPLAETPADAPATLLEKKSLDETNRVMLMEQAAKGHPMVVAALEIFGGQIEEIKEDEPEQE